MKNILTISINSEEEKEEQNIVFNEEDFPEFSFWLRQQSSKPIHSLKYWEKTVFKRLIGGHKLTLENYSDFLKERERAKQELLKFEDIDRFNYSMIIGKTITLRGIKKKVINCADANSFIHLFFEIGDSLISKIEVRNQFKNANL